MGSAHEKQVCEAALELLSTREGSSFAVLEHPELSERQRPAVELLVKLGLTEWVVEHTQVESFPGQIEDDQRFVELLGPLEDELHDKLPGPGGYRLVVDAQAVAGIKRPHVTPTRQAISEWVRTKATALGIGEAIFEQPEGVPFELTLLHVSYGNGTFMIRRFVPPELEARRQERIRKALEAKCPKLRQARGADRKSLLVLESNDIALANAQVIAEACATEIRQRSDAPDVVYLIETELASWARWVLKAGKKYYPSVPDAGPHYTGR